MPQSPDESSRVVKRLAAEAGFDVCGIAAVDPPPSRDAEHLREWLRRGRHGSMRYMARDPGRRADPSRVLPEARSVIAVALNYGPAEEPGEERGRGAAFPFGETLPAHEPGAAGRVAQYARGRDYHKVFARRLRALCSSILAAFPGAGLRAYADTGPVMEKLWAERAGLGWRGKHTNLVSRTYGSWLLLGEILADLDLAPDAAEEDYCGTCTACLDSCPTRAIYAPYRLDATLCISYLTIEHRGTIPKALRPAMGDRVFGCDDCLDACPWNRFAQAAREADFKPRPELVEPLLAELVAMDEEAFLRRFAGTAVMRAKREGLARNACVALGNLRRPETTGVLERALADASPVVREHAAWALGRIPGAAAREALETAYRREAEVSVRETLRESLGASPPPGR